MASLPKPKNTLASVIKEVLDQLIDGVAVELVTANAIAAVPFLGLPIISALFRWGVGLLADFVNENAFKFFAKLAIRLQNDQRKIEYDKIFEKIKTEEASPEDLEAARLAIDRLVNRNRP